MKLNFSLFPVPLKDNGVHRTAPQRRRGVRASVSETSTRPLVWLVCHSGVAGTRANVSHSYFLKAAIRMLWGGVWPVCLAWWDHQRSQPSSASLKVSQVHL